MTTHTLARRALGLLFVVGVLGAAACDPPQHPRNLSRTVTNNLCHVALDCCTAIEHSALFDGVQFATRDACVEELDAAIGGGGADAVDAIAAGTATFDAEAAARCTADGQAAIDRCAGGEAFITDQGTLAFTRAGFGVDDTDAECVALAQRGFTRGTVEDGDDCVASVECADFGDCIRDDGAGDFTLDARCRAAAAKGDACTARRCQPGLVCVSGACEDAPELLADGEACEADQACQSGRCVGLGDDATCTTNGQPCFDDQGCALCTNSRCADGVTQCFSGFDCPAPTGACVQPTPQCASIEVDPELCNGR